MDSDSSGNSNVSVESPSGVAVTTKQHRRKLEVFAEVLRRLRDSDFAATSLPSFEDDLSTHFKRLPSRYALDVNVGRVEEVLNHKRLLEMAKESRKCPVFDVRVVQVVKIADFGVARVKCASDMMTAETGTYRWMAPEVIEHKPYDHKADVFSFAIALWELLTGKIPYEYLTPMQAAVGVVQKGLRPTKPKNTHPEIVELLEKCWQQDPSLRPDFPEILEKLQCISKELKNRSEETRKDRHSSGGFFSALRFS